MQLLKSTLKLWLRLQCQMITNTSAAVLVKHNITGNDKVMARWPEAVATDSSLLGAAKEVMKKQRLHLQPHEKDLLVGQPLLMGDDFWGVVVVRISKRDKQDIQATIKLLQWGMTWLQFLVYQEQQLTKESQARLALNNTKDAPAQAAELLDFLAGVLKEKTLEESAITLVNKLAARCKSERVSFGVCDKRGVDVVAVSFSANFDKRTQEIQSVAAVMEEAVEQRRDIHFPVPVSETPADQKDAEAPSGVILRAHEHLHQAHRSADVHTFLLRSQNQVLAALTLESHPSTPLPLKEQQWIEQNLSLLAPIFQLKQSATTGIWQGVKHKLLNFLQRWFGPQHLLGKVVSTVTLVFILLMFIPSDYWVHGDAILENTNKHVLVAPQDGYLSEISARPGDEVKKDDVLAQLNDDDLTLERRKLASQLQQSRQEYDKALATSDRSQSAIASAQVEQAQAQLSLIEQQLARTKLTAPIDGIIVSDDIRQSQGAPVKQGDVLFEVATKEGYLAQLYIDERDISAIKAQQAGRLALTSLPGEVIEFTVTYITPISEIRDGRNYFRVEAELTKQDSLIRPGMTGSGKILVGSRSLGWIWFHDIWHWLRLTLWL